MEEAVTRFGKIHGTLHGNGHCTLKRVIGTCKEMLRDRGCETVSCEDYSLEVRPVVTGRGGRDIDVYIHSEEKVGVKFARAVVEASQGREVVLVSIDGPTPFTRKECDPRKIQFMLMKDLVYNKTHHELVPKHEVVPLPDGVERDQMPRLLESDAIAQYYAWDVGTVVRTWRVCGGCEPTAYFRVVVSS
jgi:DNA-directed RNA polymerase subunit H (RpoH/RPB5)